MPESYHEPFELLSDSAREIHRAICTLIEELEAVNWYNQRVDVSKDEELRSVMAHHRDEEIEHAAMALEWIRRNMPKFDAELREYLFTDGPLVNIEGLTKIKITETQSTRNDLGIGSTRKGA
jgi:ferritin-like protein